MSIPLKPHQSPQSLAAQGVSGFEEPVGTKWEENKKCPSNWKKLVERQQGARKWNVGKCPGKYLEGIGSRGKERGKRDGYIGIKPDPSTLSALYPVPLSTEKPSMNPGKTLAILGFMDIFYFPWTVFISLGRELLAVYRTLSRDNNSCPSLPSPLKLSLP
jgi:hypothetical protein